MNKWTFRLIGLCVVVVLSMALFKSWFFPKELPPSLQKEISIQMNKKPISPAVDSTQPPSVLPTAEKTDDDEGNKPPSPPITLISYSDEKDNKKETAQKQTPVADRPEPVPPPPKTIVEKAPAKPEVTQPKVNKPEVASKPEEKTPPPQPEVAAKVEVAEKVAQTKPEPKPEPPPPPPKPEPKKVARTTPRGGNWVQAGAFSSQENTRNFVARLKRRSWPVTTEDAVVNGKLVHRVLIGPLSPTDVEEYINILGKMGFNARQVSR